MNVLEYRPNSGPQEAFLSCPDREVLYGGAAGGGKSDALLIAAIQEVENRYSRAIIFRKTYPQLEDLILRSLELYPSQGGRYNKAKHVWTFPSGAFVRFRHCARYQDVTRYQGHAYSFIGWDELTHWEDDKCFVYMFSRLRSIDPALVLRIRATTNPGGPGHGWVMKRYNIDGAGQHAVTWVRRGQYWRRFIPAKIADNPWLAGTDYELNLDALDERSRQILKFGRWDMIEGAAFPEFTHSLHTCDAFAIPRGAKIWRGGDDGFNKPACVLWLAEVDARIFVIGEFYKEGVLAETLGEETALRDRRIPLRDGDDIVFNDSGLSGVMDSGAWAKSGLKSNDTGRAQVMMEHGAHWRQCVKGPGSRKAGWSLLHSMLGTTLRDGFPKLMIFRNCKNLIRTLPLLPCDPNDPEDVDTDAEDHAADALRYGLEETRKSKIRVAKVSG